MPERTSFDVPLPPRLAYAVELARSLREPWTLIPPVWDFRRRMRLAGFGPPAPWMPVEPRSRSALHPNTCSTCCVALRGAQRPQWPIEEAP